MDANNVEWEISHRGYPAGSFFESILRIALDAYVLETRASGDQTTARNLIREERFDLLSTAYAHADFANQASLNANAPRGMDVILRRVWSGALAKQGAISLLAEYLDMLPVLLYSSLYPMRAAMEDYSRRCETRVENFMDALNVLATDAEALTVALVKEGHPDA
jgi:hypothetical protein